MYFDSFFRIYLIELGRGQRRRAADARVVAVDGQTQYVRYGRGLYGRGGFQLIVERVKQEIARAGDARRRPGRRRAEGSNRSGNSRRSAGRDRALPYPHPSTAREKSLSKAAADGNFIHLRKTVLLRGFARRKRLFFVDRALKMC